MRQRRNYQVLAPVELSAAESTKAERMIAEAENGLAEMNVNFRWTKDKVDLIKEAAESMGVRYQTYIKQVVLRQALKDIKAVSTASLLSQQKKAQAAVPEPTPPAKAPRKATQAKAKATEVAQPKAKPAAAARAKAKPDKAAPRRRQIAEA